MIKKTMKMNIIKIIIVILAYLELISLVIYINIKNNLYIKYKKRSDINV